jgi:hypothetical protein
MVVKDLNPPLQDLISEITIQLPDEVTQEKKNEAAIKLWPVVKKAIEENRLSIRKKFND